MSGFDGTAVRILPLGRRAMGGWPVTPVAVRLAIGMRVSRILGGAMVVTVSHGSLLT
jgi:hypothetical protein